MEKITETYKVTPIPSHETYDWLLHKHYAHRIPSITYSFGLFDKFGIVGVCTFGQPATPALKKGAIGNDFEGNFLELNRLCVNEGLPRNSLSFFVSQSLKMLPKKTIVVSYADSGHFHHGYIYQATNWVYTGLSAKRTDWEIKGQENKHARHIMDKDVATKKKRSPEEVLKDMEEKYGKGNVKRIDRSRKHRYFYFLGSKLWVKKMKASLKYKEEPYPKGDNVRYDASYEPEVQLTLF